MTSTSKKIKLVTDEISPNFKATALKVAQEINLNGTRLEQSKQIYSEMKKAHPEIAWGC